MSERKYFLYLLVFVLFNFSFTSAYATIPRKEVSDILRNAQNHTQTLVNNVASFLQMSGRWAPSPQGNDMQLCQALQTFQQQLAQTSKSNNSQAYSSMQFQLQQLQTQAQNIGSLVNQTGANAAVVGSWNELQSDMLALNLILSNSNAYFAANTGYDAEPNSFNSGFGGFGSNPSFGSNSGFGYGNNYGYANNGYRNNFGYGTNPGYGSNPGYINNAFNSNQSTFSGNNQSLSSALNATEKDTNKMVSQVTTFLQMKGKWMPPAGTPEMQLCQELQTFQQAVQQASRNSSGRNSFSVLQGQLQQMNSSSQNIDRLLLQVGATPDVGGRWGKVRGDLNSVFQSFYNAGNGNFFR